MVLRRNDALIVRVLTFQQAANHFKVFSFDNCTSFAQVKVDILLFLSQHVLSKVAGRILSKNTPCMSELC